MLCKNKHGLKATLVHAQVLAEREATAAAAEELRSRVHSCPPRPPDCRLPRACLERTCACTCSAACAQMTVRYKQKGSIRFEILLLEAVHDLPLACASCLHTCICKAQAGIGVSVCKRTAAAMNMEGHAHPAHIRETIRESDSRGDG